MTLSSGIDLMIHDRLQVTVASEPALPRLTEPKGKRVHSPSLIEEAGKVKKSKGSSLLSDLASSSNKAPIMEIVMEVGASLDLLREVVLTRA